MGNSQDFRFLTFNGYVSQNLRAATAGEIAAKNLTTQVGQFQIRLLDELATLTPDVIEQNEEVKYV